VVNVHRDPHVPKIVLPVTSVLLPPFEALPLQQSAAPQQPVATYDDQLTPRLLEALGVLDAGLEDLDYVEKSAQEAAAATARAAEEEEEPAWLRSASVDITSTSEAISSSLAASLSLAPGESTTGAQLSAVSTTLALELAREEARIAALETQSHHLRASAEAQARTSLEVLQQLELTRSAAQGTQAAARRIVEDHEKDIALLLSKQKMPTIFVPLLASLALLPAAMVRSTAVAASSNVAVAVSSKVGMAVRRRAVLTTAAGVALALALPTAAANAAADDAIYRPAPGSLVGTTVLITGANTGLGLESAKRLAKAGANVVIAARTQAKADGAIAKVSSGVALAADQRLVGVSLDLADLSSVRTLPARLEAALGAKDAPIDVLLNNAGVMAIPERLETADGFEKTMGINHLGHFALVAALLPSLKRAANGFRVINVSSEAHRFASTDSIRQALDANLDPPYAAGGWGNYGLSKAANVLFTVELQTRIEAAGLRGSAVSLHPGVVQTDLQRY
jgi:NAD(P)-dependent dehydrogenase (short-subunit alcohol dehydrogenase family)